MGTLRGSCKANSSTSCHRQSPSVTKLADASDVEKLVDMAISTMYNVSIYFDIFLLGPRLAGGHRLLTGFEPGSVWNIGHFKVKNHVISAGWVGGESASWWKWILCLHVFRRILEIGNSRSKVACYRRLKSGTRSFDVSESLVYSFPTCEMAECITMELVQNHSWSRG